MLIAMVCVVLGQVVDGIDRRSHIVIAVGANLVAVGGRRRSADLAR